MNMGWLDVCLRVGDVVKSRAFYEGLGFWKVEGHDREGWAILTNGVARIGLYTKPHMSDSFCLNFRGSHVADTVANLKAKGYVFESEEKTSSDGSGSANLRDPDGYLLYIDTAPGEVMKTEP